MYTVPGAGAKYQCATTAVFRLGAASTSSDRQGTENQKSTWQLYFNYTKQQSQKCGDFRVNYEKTLWDANHHSCD